MPPKGKKNATARRQEPPRQPERRQEPPRQPKRRQEPPRQPERRQEPPRQPERRQETADRFTLVLPPQLSTLPPRQASASQSETQLNHYHLAKLPHLNRGPTLNHYNLAKL